jgi:DNA-binding SARP family transcriptional activator/DNA-binding NarL/FixJ family response regulator
MMVQTAVGSRVVLYGTQQATQSQINQHVANHIELVSTNDNFPPENLDFLGKFDLLLYNLSLSTAQDVERLYKTCYLCKNAEVPVVLLASMIESENLIAAYREGLSDCCVLPNQLTTLAQVVDMQIKKTKRLDTSLMGRLLTSMADVSVMGAIAPGIAPFVGASAPTSTCMIHAQFFGVFKVWVKGKAIEMPNASKVRSLLAWLLIHSRTTIHRDRLAQLLWADLDVKSARNNLSVTLTHLRRAFGTQQLDCDLVVLKGDCYQLNPTLSISSDLAQYNRLYDEVREHLIYQRKAEVARLYRSMTDLATFEVIEDLSREHWTIKIRDDFRERNSDALYWLSNFYLENEDHESAIETIKKALMIDDCQEDMHLKLAACYMAINRVHRAHQQKETCARVLAEKLDIFKLSKKWEEILA